MKWAIAGFLLWYVIDLGRREQATRQAVAENLRWYVREQQKTMDWLYRARFGDDA